MKAARGLAGAPPCTRFNLSIESHSSGREVDSRRQESIAVRPPKSSRVGLQSGYLPCIFHAVLEAGQRR